MRTALRSAAMMAALLGAGASLGGMFNISSNGPPGSLASGDGVRVTARKAMQGPSLQQRSAETAMLRSFISSGNGRRSFPGCGWPVATDRRMARKRRNQAKNKRAHRR